MSEAQKRERARQEITELWQAIEPSKNEEIARRALELADHYLVKAENQAKQIQCLEQRNQRMRGRWHLTDAYPHWLCCDQCHKKMLPNAEWVELYNIPTNFCPNCGADMRGTE